MPTNCKQLVGPQKLATLVKKMNRFQYKRSTYVKPGDPRRSQRQCFVNPQRWSPE